MLVSLATAQTISAGGSATYPYACNSIQKVFIDSDDSAGGSNALDHTITIQLGQRTICNGVDAWGMAGLQSLKSIANSSGAKTAYEVDLGNHEMLHNENVYVTIRNTSASGDLNLVDISLLVDEPQGEFPVKYTEYSDNVFTAEDVLLAISYSSSSADVSADANSIEIRDAVNSSSPSLISANNWFATNCFQNKEYFGLLKRCVYPLTTTFNYSASATTNRILVASQMGTSQAAVRQAQRQKAITKSQVGK